MDSEEIYRRFLGWRDIDPDKDKPCGRCGGSGRRTYPNTTTWIGGIGGQMVTVDVCDHCWGSGIQDRPWTNLKKVAADEKRLRNENRRLRESLAWIVYQLHVSEKRQRNRCPKWWFENILRERDLDVDELLKLGKQIDDEDSRAHGLTPSDLED